MTILVRRLESRRGDGERCRLEVCVSNQKSFQSRGSTGSLSIARTGQVIGKPKNGDRAVLGTALSAVNVRS